MQKCTRFTQSNMGMDNGWSDNGNKKQQEFISFHPQGGGGSFVLAIRQAIQVKKKRPAWMTRSPDSGRHRS
jgi:hypothetical protein